jgi:hypothetical protein
MDCSFPTLTMNDRLSSMISSSRPSSEFTAVGKEEVEDGGGEGRQLMRDVPKEDGGGTGVGDGEQGAGS